MIRLFSLLMLIALASTSAFTQEVPTKVTDLNYGNTGESIIRTVHVANGELYGNFEQFYGNDSVGLLSILD